jgi:DNA-binding NtrC family response regulator
VLVVEDDAPLCGAIARLAQGWGAQVFEAHALAPAIELLGRSPDLLIVDLRLGEQTALPLIEAAAHHRPAPAIVAMSGQASPEEAFQLGQLGVRAYLPKPLSTEALVAKVEQALAEAPDFEPWISGCVGHASLRGVQSRVRRLMLEQALARAGGSRSGAARLLRVSRQAIQQLLQRQGPRGRRPADAEHGAALSR